MSSEILSRSRVPRVICPIVFVLLCCAASRAQVQAQPPSAAQTQATSPVTKYDPTKPEAQPNLSVDHDPVLSPDPEDNLPPHPAVAAGAAPGQEIEKGRSGIYTLQENVNEVLLQCAVVDENGHLVKDLSRGDFRVWENGVPQTIASFQHQDVAVSMGILVDNSGSMRDKRAAVDAAALDLVRASNRDDAAFVVNFSDRAYLDQGFTNNINALERGLSRFDSRGTTAIYDAVAASADELAKNAKQQKQVLLIITDGADNASRLTMQQAIRRVQNLGGPVVYSIGLLYGDDADEAGRARDALEDLSRETGGIAYFPASLQEVGSIAQEVAQDIRNQYTIGYHSTKPASLGGYRTVRVEAQAPGHRRLIVRTRRGYYPKTVQRIQRAVANQQ
jgi:VWFA-related protein